MTVCAGQALRIVEDAIISYNKIIIFGESDRGGMRNGEETGI